MNQAEKRKLETIVGKLEDLENTGEFSQKEKDAMRSAKSRLLEIL